MNGVFISYCESSAISKPIVDQLGDFFRSWGLAANIVAQSETTASPHDSMLKLLQESQFLIQIYAGDHGKRDWMTKERSWWEAISASSGTLHRRDPIILTAPDANGHDPDMDDDIVALKRLARLTVISVKNEPEMRKILSAILVECGRLKVEHGAITIPECCQSSKKSIDLRYVRDFITNFVDANEKGLHCVFQDRAAAEDEIRKAMIRLANGQEVKMIGFTLKRFVHPGSTVGNAFGEAIGRGAMARLLVLNHDCEAAKERTRIESPDQSHDKSKLVQDGRAVNKHWRQSTSVAIKSYSTPYAGLLLFPDMAFIEIYHLGTEINQDGICGQVPILLIRDESLFYRIFASHFENMWVNAITINGR